MIRRNHHFLQSHSNPLFFPLHLYCPSSVPSLYCKSLVCSLHLGICFFFVVLFTSLLYLLDSTYERYLIQYFSFSVWLISLSMISSKSIHVATNGKREFIFFYGWVVFLCVCVCDIFIHSSVDELLGCFYTFSPSFLKGQFSHSVVSNSLRPHELQHARPPCPSPTPRIHPNSCPLS